MDWIILISYVYATIPNFISVISFRLYKSNRRLSDKIEDYSKKYGVSSYIVLILIIVLINANMAPQIDKIFNRRDDEKNKLELREYGVGAQILSAIGIKKIILLTNSKKKIIALDGFNLQIISQENI